MYICKRLSDLEINGSKICAEYVEYNPWYMDLALTRTQAQEIAIAIASFFVTMFILRELRKRLF